MRGEVVKFHSCAHSSWILLFKINESLQKVVKKKLSKTITKNFVEVEAVKHVKPGRADAFSSG